MAAMSTNGDDCMGMHKKASTIKQHVELNVGYITGGKLATKDLGKLNTNLSRLLCQRYHWRAMAMVGLRVAA